MWPDRRVAFVLLLAVASAALTPAEPMVVDTVHSNRFTQPEPVAPPRAPLGLGPDYRLVLRSSVLEVYLRDENASLRIRDRRSGYVWGGLASPKPDDMNRTWSGIGNSMVTMEYFTARGLERRQSIADAGVDRVCALAGDELVCDVSYTELGISFRFTVRIAEDTLRFHIRGDSIRETGEYTLGALMFFPFLGAVRGAETPGYVLVPDGSGALIRFREPTLYLNHYESRVWGRDYGIDHLSELNDLKSNRTNDNLKPQETVMAPVFGLVHGAGENAVLAVVDEGAEYASIVAYPAGITTPYTWAAARHVWRQKYLQPTTRSGAGVQVVQPTPNRTDAGISFRFITGSAADYVGMARLYREDLIRRGELGGSERVDTQVPLRLDVIAAELRRGFLLETTLAVTPPAVLLDMVDQLRRAGVGSLTVVYQGWQKGGLHGQRPRRLEYSRVVGGREGLAGLIRDLDGRGVDLFLHENLTTVSERQINREREAGNSLSQALIRLHSDDTTLLFPDTYFVDTRLVSEYLVRRAGELATLGARRLALQELGNRLYAENERDNVTTRTEALAGRRRAARTALDASLDELAFSRPNQYLWPWTTRFLDIPLDCSRHLFETDTVPFLQIVLKGAMDYWAPYANEGAYTREDTLRMIEYGAYPSYLVTGLPNPRLESTPSETLYSTYFEDWRETMIRTHAEVDAVLSRVEGASITGRRVPVAGVVLVDYEGGRTVIVNYTDQPWTTRAGTVVPSRSAVVEEGP